MKRTIVTVLLALVFVMPAAAQDEPTLPTEDTPVVISVEPPETEPIAPEDTSTVISWEQLLLIVSESVAGSMLVTVIVNGLKVFDPNINPQQVTTVVSLVIVALVWGARATGQVALLESVFGWLSVIVPAGVNFLALLLGAPAVYHMGKALHSPVLGYNPPHTAVAYSARHPEG